MHFVWFLSRQWNFVLLWFTTTLKSFRLYAQKNTGPCLWVIMKHIASFNMRKKRKLVLLWTSKCTAQLKNCKEIYNSHSDKQWGFRVRSTRLPLSAANKMNFSVRLTQCWIKTDYNKSNIDKLVTAVHTNYIYTLHYDITLSAFNGMKYLLLFYWL